ncbi:MAG: Rieske 2Fe-2S domain-containing protein [Gammaproteobacteria bacterium]|jgi:nitrite reductase/ring-hydroxylating ferredoxin subunit|nr:Rieske 2Fe-2S domain-containing protein [Gammaproteobacteria bacterium]
MDLIALAKTGEIGDDTAKEFSLTQYQPPLELFVIRKTGRIFAYINRCPHTGVTLNWMAHQFFDIENEFIQCATHGALFTVENGHCVRGPCAGAYLQPAPIIIEDGMIYLQPREYHAGDHAGNDSLD